MSPDRVALAGRLAAAWDMDRPDASRDRLLGMAASAPDVVTRAVILTQAARAAGLVGDGAAASGLLADAARHDDDPEVAVRVELERGRLLRTAGDPDAAVPLFTRAAALSAERLDSCPFGGLHVDALHMLALTLLDPERRVTATRDVLAVARSSGDPTAGAWIPSLLNNLGCALVDAGRPDEALAVFFEALDLRRRRDDRRATQAARWMVGWALRLVGRLDEARRLQRDLLDDLRADGVDSVHALRELELLGWSDSPDWHSA